MKIRGSIRRGQSGIDVGFITDEVNKKWETLEDGPFKETIRLFYDLLLSQDSRRVIGGKIFSVQQRAMGSNNVRSVMFPIGIGRVNMTRFDKLFNGKVAPPDRVSIDIEVPTSNRYETEEIQEPV